MIGIIENEKVKVTVNSGEHKGKTGSYTEKEYNCNCDVNAYEAVDCSCDSIARVFLDGQKDFTLINESLLKKID